MKKRKFHSRALRLSDAQEYARTATAISACDGTDKRVAAGSATLSWQEPNFDLEEYSLGLFSTGGTLAAYAILSANAEIPVHSWLTWGVHPDHYSDNLSQCLFQWAGSMERKVLVRCPEDARVTLLAETSVGYAFAENALETAGFVPLRRAHDMQITLTQRPTVPQLPAGFAYRQYRHEDDLPLLTQTVLDAFSDHFGYVKQPFAKELAEFRHWLNNDPHFDPSLVLLVVDKPLDVIAGSLIGLKEDPNRPCVGYVDMIGVRRAYRRRGLAQTMLYKTFAEFWDRGLRTVGLDVDGESLTNAVALYERVGMQIHSSYMSYERVLREGVELGKMELDQ